MVSKIAIVLTCVAAVTASIATGQDKGALPDWRRALAAGEVNEGREVCLQAISEVLQGEGPIRPVERARAEAMALELRRSIARDPEPAAFASRLEAMDFARAWPRLRSEIALAMLRAHSIAGDAAAVKETADRIGVLRNWALIGPFDNERGGGFDSDHPPTATFDPRGDCAGKDQRVSWRRLDVTLNTGRIHFHSLVEPSTQAIVFIETAVHCPEDADALLWVGVGGAYKLRVNGAEVASSRYDRAFAFDQEVVSVRLVKGWNAIGLMVASQARSAQSCLRLTTRRGTAGSSWRSSAVFADLQTARSTKAADGDPRPIGRAMRRLTALARKGELEVESVEDFSTLRGERNSSLEERLETAEILQRTIEAHPRSAALHVALARTLNLRSRMQAERDDNRRRAALETALSIDPENVLALEALARHYTFSFPLAKRALGYIARLRKAAPRHTTARLLDAVTEMRRRGIQSVLRDFEVADDAGSKNPEVVRWRVGRLVAVGRLDKARQLVEESFGKRRGDGRLRSVASDLYRRLGRHDLVEKMAREDMVRNPLNPRMYLRVAAFDEGRDRLEDSLSVLAEGLEVAPRNRDLLRKAAEICQRLGRADRARNFMTRLLAAFPGDKHARRYAEFLDSDSRPFEDDYAIDLAPLIEAAADWSDNPSQLSHRYLSRETIVDVHADGTSNNYTRELIQILEDSGVRRFSTVPLGVGRGQVLRVRQARVHRAAGGVVDCDLSDIGTRGGNIAMPNLSKGDIVELAWRSDDLRPSFFGNYYGAQFFLRPEVDVNCRLSRLTLLLPKSRQWYFHSRNGAPEPLVVQVGDALESRTWEIRDLRALVPERRMPPLEELSPSIQVSTYENWDAFTAWWWNLIKGQYTITDEMRQKLAELTKDCKSEWETVRAVYEFVISEIRYVAWEFGVHGYKPYKANTIYERSFGDCKDKAILINTLLREKGIVTYPVLINSQGVRTKEDITLPIVQHFNHCIAYWPGGEDDDGIFLDGTAEFHPADALPSSDREAAVVVVEEGRARVAYTGDHDPTSSVLEYELDYACAVDGPTRVRVRALHSGLYGASARASLDTEGDRRRVLESEFSDHFRQFELLEFRVSGLENLRAPVIVEADVKVQELGTRRGKAIDIAVAGGGGKLSGLCAKETRVHDMLLPAWHSEKVTRRFHVPDGWGVEGLPEPVKIDNALGHYESSCSLEDGQVVVTRVFYVKKTRIAPDEYPVFREFLGLVDQTDEKTFTLVEEKR